MSAADGQAHRAHTGETPVPPMNGLRDAHLHVAEFGAELSALDVSDCASKAACLERIAAEAARRAEQRESSAWIVAVRARPEGWRERAWPTANELHDAAGGRPCVVKSFDFHSLAASETALEAAGFLPPLPRGGGHRRGRSRNSDVERSNDAGETSVGEGNSSVALPLPPPARREGSQSDAHDPNRAREEAASVQCDASAAHGRDARPTDFVADQIELDENGRPTGFLLEAMAQRVLDAMPPLTFAQQKEHVRLACDELSRRGFVEAHDMRSRPWLVKALMELDDAGELPLRIVLHPVVEDFDDVARQRDAFERDSIRLGGLKVFTDGTLNSRTAWMLHPFAEPLADSPRGRRMMTDEAFVAAIKRAQAAGLPIVAHAIGDAAVRWCLDLIEAHGDRSLPHRIEHCEFIDEADVLRFVKLGVVASVQPCHLLPDIEALHRLTPHRLNRVLPLRELVDACEAAGRDAAELIWFGSDAPVVDPDPEDNAQAAVFRRRAGMSENQAIAPEQAISHEEAMRLMLSTKASVRS